jgi:hypothetical protein
VRTNVNLSNEEIDMNIKTRFVFSVVGLVLSASVNAAQINDLSAYGGTFGGEFNGGFPFIGGPYVFENVVTYNMITDSGQSTSNGTELASFNANGLLTQLFTTGPASGTVNGSNSGISNGDVIEFDISSLDLYWNGTSFNVGGMATGTVTNVSANAFDYSATWTGMVSTGGFAGSVYNLSLTGSGSVVPVPAAIWLFGSGLFGLLAVARRKLTNSDLGRGILSQHY